MSAKQVSKLAGEAYSLFVCTISEVISFPAVFAEDGDTGKLPNISGHLPKARKPYGLLHVRAHNLTGL